MDNIKALYTNDNLPSSKVEYSLAPGVFLLLIRDETSRLLDFGRDFYAVSESGTTMLLEALNCGIAEAAAKLASYYHIGAHQAKRDLDIFLADLRKRSLICPTISCRKRNKVGEIIYQNIIFIGLRCIYLLFHSLRLRSWWLLTLSRIAFRMFGWNQVVAAWSRYHHSAFDKDSNRDLQATAKRIDGVVRDISAKHILSMGCKERALSCWALLCYYGIPATLVVGVNLFPLASHCWCEFDSMILSDYEDRCETFTPVVTY